MSGKEERSELSFRDAVSLLGRWSIILLLLFFVVAGLVAFGIVLGDCVDRDFSKVARASPREIVRRVTRRFVPVMRRQSQILHSARARSRVHVGPFLGKLSEASRLVHGHHIRNALL